MPGAKEGKIQPVCCKPARFSSFVPCFFQMVVGTIMPRDAEAREGSRAWEPSVTAGIGRGRRTRFALKGAAINMLAPFGASNV
jgi:hypothetical protein